MNDKYSKENLYAYLVENNPLYRSERIKDALSWAYDLHMGQVRKSGEPYIVHPLEVAKQLISIDLDEDSIISALLHDVIEDCGVTYQEIFKKFGKTIADLVQAETKVDDITTNASIRFQDYENLRRMLFSITDDIRVLLIRLSDRLHNMKTIEYLKEERRISYSQETLNVYVPLAEYINLGVWQKELADLSFKYVNPELYNRIDRLIKDDPRSNIENIHKIQSELENLMRENRIPCKISGRIKSAYSINNKIKFYLNKGKITEFSTTNIYDLLAFRIITTNNNIIDCYKVLGVIHSKYSYIKSEFDDYISKPKDNGYQSLQTDVYIDNVVVEIQIRTAKMHDFNEFGAASHIAYKLNATKGTNALSWVKSLVNWQDKQEYSIKNVLSDKVFVFTPKGQVIEMQKGSSVIDFAYRIHSDIGNSCIGAKINGKIVPLNTKIEIGQVIEIQTSKTKKIPSKEWLNWVLPKTASIIKREISRLDLEKQVEEGKNIFRNMMKDYDLHLSQKELDIIYSEYSASDEEKFYRHIFLKMISPKVILNHYIRLNQKKSEIENILKDKSEVVEVLVKGHSGMKYYIAQCCKPHYGQDIVGFISLEHGITVHSRNCPELRKLSTDRITEVEWKG